MGGYFLGTEVVGDTNMQREYCLLDDEDVRQAIRNLIQQLGKDDASYNLQTCSGCQLDIPTELSINIHCQLKSVYDILVSIEEMVKELSAEKDSS